VNKPLIQLMQDLESRYRIATGLVDRSQYKIFYGPLRPAEILVLGINPGGDPSEIPPGGAGTGASSSYYENDEHDLLDCEWPENTGLRKLLAPLVGGNLQEIRHRVVKTNMAFRRSLSTKSKHINIGSAKAEAVPFLDEITNIVRPKLILLTGVDLPDFAERYSRRSHILVQPIRAEDIQHTVFAAARLTLRRVDREVLVVQVDHASQFSWTYDRYDVVNRIRTLRETHV
jgi:hypothetical protein